MLAVYRTGGDRLEVGLDYQMISAQHAPQHAQQGQREREGGGLMPCDAMLEKRRKGSAER